MAKNLYQLIHSLNSREKAYFKKYAHKLASAKQSVYYNLFNAIAKQKEYNEEKLIKLFKKQFAQKKQFSAAKNYLYNLILNCLCDYNRKEKILSKVHIQIEKIEFLSSKKLYSQALVILEKALLDVLKHELFPYAMYLLFCKDGIVKRMGNIKGVLTYNDHLFEKEFEIIEQWKKFREYSLMMNTFFAIEANQSLTKAIDEVALLNSLINSTYYQEEKYATSLLAQTTRLHVLSYGGNLSKDEEGTYLAKKQNVELFQQNLDFCKLYLMRYISALSNLIVAEIFRYNKESMLKYIKDLNEIKTSHFEEEMYKTNVLISAWLLYYSVNQISENFLEHIKEWALKFMTIKNHIGPNNQIEIIFLLTYNYFLAKDYYQTIKWAEYFEENKSKETSLEFWVGIKLIHLIANFEMGYNFFVEYTGTSTYRFIRKKGKIYQTELALVSFLQKMVNLPKREIKKSHFQKFGLKVKKIQGDKDSCAYGLFDLLGWIEYKISQFD